MGCPSFQDTLCVSTKAVLALTLTTVATVDTTFLKKEKSPRLRVFASKSAAAARPSGDSACGEA